MKLGNKVTITDPEMTRFSITMEQALDFILECTVNGKASEIYIPKLKAYNIMDVKKAISEMIEDLGEKIVGIRPGEKLHEVLINREEMRYSWDIGNKYMISNPLRDEKSIIESYQNISKIQNSGEYSSDNTDRMTVKEIKETIHNSGLL